MVFLHAADPFGEGEKSRYLRIVDIMFYFVKRFVGGFKKEGF